MWHDSIKDLRHQFKRGLGRMRSQLSKTSEEMVPTGKTDCGGMSVTLQCRASPLTKGTYGAMSTSTADQINSIERLVMALKDEIQQHNVEN